MKKLDTNTRLKFKSIWLMKNDYKVCVAGLLKGSKETWGSVLRTFECSKMLEHLHEHWFCLTENPEKNNLNSKTMQNLKNFKLELYSFVRETGFRPSKFECWTDLHQNFPNVPKISVRSSVFEVKNIHFSEST